MLVVFIIIFAHLVWAVERKDNPDQFPADYANGIDDAIWWATTTVTTVGYGDKSPLTALGRMFGIALMFIGVCLFAIFAGEVASAATSSSLTNRELRGIADMVQQDRICTPYGIYMTTYLSRHVVSGYVHPAGLIQGCIDDVMSGEAKGMFLEEYTIRYMLSVDPQLMEDLYVVEGTDKMRLAPAFATGDGAHELVKEVCA